MQDSIDNFRAQKAAFFAKLDADFLAKNPQDVPEQCPEAAAADAAMPKPWEE